MSGTYRDKQVVVVGAGRSGLALCDFFCRREARVTLSDRRSREELSDLAAGWEGRLRLDLGGHTPEVFCAADLVVISPGVPLDIPAIAAAMEQGVPVLGEIEIAWRELAAPVVGITGTNGKSTVTALCGEIFTAWGRQTFVGGNLGTPLISAVDGTDWNWLVVEISSFQLEAIRDFRARWGLLLNLSEDHLDRYPDMASYQAAKARLFENQTPSDFAVVNLDDAACMHLAAAGRARQIGFSSSRVPEQGMGYRDGNIVWRWQGQERLFPVARMRLKGLHNVENVMAAMIPPLVEGCPGELAWDTVCAFSGLPHRMVLVRTLDGVAWYNDSKGTNVGSVVKSLAGLEAPVTLIAGGKDKGGDYRVLRGTVAEKVAHLILIGQAAGRMEQALGDCATIHRAGTLPEAVTLARRLTPTGGSVLLSPGCSSFDMFRSFEERGEVFTKAVLDLPETEKV